MVGRRPLGTRALADDVRIRLDGIDGRLARVEDRQAHLDPTDERSEQVHAAVTRTDARMGEITAAIERTDRRVGAPCGLAAEHEGAGEERRSRDEDLRDALLAIRDDESGARERLVRTRSAAGYEEAFTEQDQRRPAYPDDVLRRWLVLGTPPIAAGLRDARGRFISVLGDDDELLTDAISTLLARARRDRLEYVYSQLQRIGTDRATDLVGASPPAPGNVGLQGSLLHAHLRWFEPELSDASFGLPSDWALIRRLWRAGARIGFEERVTTLYHPGGTLQRQQAEADRYRERQRVVREAFSRIDS